MYTVVVGLMTYVVENQMAADVLKEAATFDKKGDFEQAREKKKLACRIENDRAYAREYQKGFEAIQAPTSTHGSYSTGVTAQL